MKRYFDTDRPHQERRHASTALCFGTRNLPLSYIMNPFIFTKQWEQITYRTYFCLASYHSRDTDVIIQIVSILNAKALVKVTVAHGGLRVSGRWTNNELRPRPLRPRLTNVNGTPAPLLDLSSAKLIRQWKSAQRSIPTLNNLMSNLLLHPPPPLSDVLSQNPLHPTRIAYH